MLDTPECLAENSWNWGGWQHEKTAEYVSLRRFELHWPVTSPLQWRVRKPVECMGPVQETSCQISDIREKNSTAFRTQTISFDKHPLWLLDSKINLFCGASSYIPRFQSFTNDFTVAIFDQFGNRNGATEWCGVSQTTILSKGGSNQIKQKHINQLRWKTLCPGQGMGNQQGNTPESPSLH